MGAAIAFTANYILQFFIFLPFLTFSQRRISAKRNVCICCYVHKDYDLLESYRKEHPEDVVKYESQRSNHLKPTNNNETNDENNNKSTNETNNDTNNETNDDFNHEEEN